MYAKGGKFVKHRYINCNKISKNKLYSKLNSRICKKEHASNFMVYVIYFINSVLLNI
ncbi:hypothetical protein GCM10022393_09230 [Aquimarina addita]|uniref:Uncharacterized protein n=1 Tax=Aquimarina addita TaxID=870485 RepID=A0ABP7XCU6_9FLAO